MRANPTIESPMLQDSAMSQGQDGLVIAWVVGNPSSLGGRTTWAAWEVLQLYGIRRYEKPEAKDRSLELSVDGAGARF